MKVIIARTEKGDVVNTEIQNNLETLQNIVGGYIQCCAPMEIAEQGIEIIANEEGLLQGLELNENIFPFFFVGKVIFVGVNNNDFCSLTPQQITFIRTWLSRL